MMLLAIYTVQCEMRARMNQQELVRAEHARMARALQLAGEAKRREERSRPRKVALKRLLPSLGHAGA
jgi:hypothetical protein